MNNTAMIWGAGGDIGQALAAELKQAGWHVLAVTRGAAALDDQGYEVITADPLNPMSVEQAAMQAAMAAGPVGLWVYAAGDIAAAPVEDLDPATFRRILDANFTGAYQAYRGSLPLLAEDATVVFIGAVSERLRLPGLSAYAAAKAALEAFAEALAKEDRKRRYLVIRPGAVATKLWHKVPMPMPKNAISPAEAATQIKAAVESGAKGQVDF